MTDAEWLDALEDAACTHGHCSLSVPDRTRLILLMRDKEATRALATYNYSSRPVTFGLAPMISFVAAARDGIVSAVTDRIVNLDSSTPASSPDSMESASSILQGQANRSWRRTSRGSKLE